ncbi:mannitol dehydrogenase family protein [Rhodococcus pseudokoreensis]|uniref:Mannitol-1-phosphate 5-dehydrogenase n=1 Tax=Rhodococcus pseudokoreensis TaxID=2811421 RepID=A0A974ZWE1_9NOCA|nr:mannitol dehydrogenase family protein [Rhodococcus pseudokoreensis]QSE92815.1 mannitol dehydrogenase family protein [Rhodococcus pseudokoreensis]
MTEHPLSRRNVPAAALIHRRVPEGTGIVHLGLGNFHRAHQAVYTALAMEREPGPWGILGVASRSSAVADAMTAQDLLYSVVEISPGGSRVSVPGSHTGTVVAEQDPESVVHAIADPATKIVTITVTEHGYTVSPETGSLDLDSDAVRRDLAESSTPRTTIGQIARALALRASTHGTPITILSCDNLLANGRQTERLVREFVGTFRAPLRDEVLGWMDASVTFPNSMVDRIVPSSSDRYNETALTHLGVRDTIAVPAEPFTMWVMEEKFAAGRPAWEHGGALFTDDVEPYELMKVRLLNGTHSLIAYLGALDGCATIPESVARPFVEDAARRILRDEYLPTVTVPEAVDTDDYIRQLFSRWSNTALGHRTSQVGSDGSVKLAQRIPIPALEHLGRGDVPQFLALTVAAYLACIAPLPGFEPGPHARSMTDPARPRLAGMADNAASTTEFVRSVFVDGGLFPSVLATHTEFVSRIADFVDIIVRHGPAVAAGEASAPVPDLGAITLQSRATI